MLYFTCNPGFGKLTTYTTLKAVAVVLAVVVVVMAAAAAVCQKFIQLMDISYVLGLLDFFIT